MIRIVLAFRFLTRLPMPGVAGDALDFAAAMRWFPLVGLAIGTILSAAVRLGATVDPWVGALAGLLAWVWVTGALHLDGLADLVDGRAAAHGDRARMLAVMADPHIGSFGVVAIAMQLLAKLVLLHAISATPSIVLIFIPFAARIGPLLWTLWLAPLHAGLAARFSAGVAPRHLAAWSVALLAGAWFAPAILAAPLLMIGWGWWLQRHMGGVSGDCHGAGIELLETMLLIAALASRTLIGQ